LEKLPNRKALGPDRIANKVLKEVYKELAPYLAEVFTAVAHLRYYPKIRKSTTTVTLRKDGKADYSLTNSYRPIALENTIVKVYKKLLAILIS
jgi:5-methylcytosine-specific restriction endonuclease McrBC regulatory subunit McrC